VLSRRYRAAREPHTSRDVPALTADRRGTRTPAPLVSSRLLGQRAWGGPPDGGRSFHPSSKIVLSSRFQLQRMLTRRAAQICLLCATFFRRADRRGAKRPRRVGLAHRGPVARAEMGRPRSARGGDAIGAYSGSTRGRPLPPHLFGYPPGICQTQKDPRVDATGVLCGAQLISFIPGPCVRELDEPGYLTRHEQVTSTMLRG
jgi:hypothetical protein